MSKISQYPNIVLPTLNDKVIGTDVGSNNETKNFLVSDLLALGVGGTGATGPQGPQGIAGPAGAQGVQGVAGIQGSVGPIGPAGLNWQGTYSAVASYVLNDAVGFGGASYYNILPCTACAGDPSTNTTNWALLANIGATGPQGPAGPQGIQGLTGIQGVQGVTGATGATGAQGPAGNDGVGGITTAGTNISITGLGTSISPYVVNSTVPYTIYKALVTNSNGIFTIIQLENTIGDGSNTSPADIQWSNPSNGLLRATKTGAFTSSNIFITVPCMKQSTTPYILTGQKTTSDIIDFNIYLHDGTYAFTPNLSKIPIEIRIY